MAVFSKLSSNLKNLFFVLKFLLFNKLLLRKLLIALGLSIPTIVFVFKLVKSSIFKRLSPAKNGQQQQIQPHKKASPSFDRQFLKQFSSLLRIMFPKLFSRQVALLITHTLTLMCRTFLSIYVAKLEGILVRNIVQKSFTEFARNLIKWLLIAVPATSCNSLIRYLECKLDLEVKTELVKNSLNMYFDSRVYYRIALKQNDDSVQVDQNLTDDIDKFTSLFVHLYSHLTKPILDISLITITLISLAKKNNFNYLEPTTIGLLVISLTGTLMRRLSPKFGKMAANVAKQKGYLRYLYNRIQTNSEEIAFYSGETTELNLIKHNYALLKFELEKVYFSKLWYIILEQFLTKYVWSAAGLCMISLPVILSDQKNRLNAAEGVSAEDNEMEISERTENFTTAKNLLNSAADAVERIITSYKEINEFAGYTKRVYDMFKLFNEVKSSDKFDKLNDRKLIQKNNSVSDLLQHPNESILPGIVHESSEQNSIVIDSIKVITPGGDIIVPSLSLKIERGMNLLITGPNGCGKSSLFRIISGLWPLYGGEIYRPKINEMYYVPQRPYLAIGKLRDQIIYPDCIKDMKRKQITDDDLMTILEIVNLQHVVIREGGLDAIADWKDVLSGGEKQRIGLSRLFYHKPKFAFLDECTSAVSVDVEGKIYMKAINDYNITLLTIAHRATLWQYHNYILQFDGLGNWKFEELNMNLSDRLSLKQEKDSLEKLLLGIPNTQARLKELCDILGESSIAFTS